jgi:hypothetical protein
MTTSVIAIVLIVIATGLAALGGLGVFGLGQDSRALDPQGYSDDRPGRSMLS